MRLPCQLASPRSHRDVWPPFFTALAMAEDVPVPQTRAVRNAESVRRQTACAFVIVVILFFTCIYLRIQQRRLLPSTVCSMIIVGLMA